MPAENQHSIVTWLEHYSFLSNEINEWRVTHTFPEQEAGMFTQPGELIRVVLPSFPPDVTKTYDQQTQSSLRRRDSASMTTAPRLEHSW